MIKPLIFAYYYIWYYGAEDKRWPTFNRDYPPALGFYRSDDPRVLYQHLLWAAHYGIDGFLLEWFGTVTPDGIYSDSNLALLRSLLSGFPDLRYAIFYDQAGRFGTLDFADPDKREEFLADMEKIALDNFSHPNYWRIGGRPVVVIYVTRAATGGYGNLIAEARERMARSGYAPYIIGDEVWWGRDISRVEFYDAVTAFNLQSDSQILRTGGNVRGFADLCTSLYLAVQRRASETGVEIIPSIGHAYNDEIVRSNLPLMPTVNPGELPQYREDLIYAAQQMAAVHAKSMLPIDFGIAPLFVNSFNEWPERSAVEPSAEIEAFNACDDRANGRRIVLPAPGYCYLEGLREVKGRLIA